MARLLEKRWSLELSTTGSLRLEQLYLFTKNHLNALLEQYPNLESLTWCREEPVNQGAWDGIRHRF